MAHALNANGTDGTSGGHDQMSRPRLVAHAGGQGGHHLGGMPPLKGGTPQCPLSSVGGTSPRASLNELARRIDRLAPSRHDPEAFHLEKDAIARTLRRLARTETGPSSREIACGAGSRDVSLTDRFSKGGPLPAGRSEAGK